MVARKTAEFKNWSTTLNSNSDVASSTTHIDASTVGDTQTPSNLGEFDCITLLGLVKRSGGLHVSIRVHYSEKNDWGQGVLIDCASVITLDALSVITLTAWCTPACAGQS